jgi:hypothetical protein
MSETETSFQCRKLKPVSVVVLVPPEAFGSPEENRYSGENRNIAIRGENRDLEENRSRSNCIKNCSLADHNFYLITNQK